MIGEGTKYRMQEEWSRHTPPGRGSASLPFVRSVSTQTGRVVPALWESRSLAAARSREAACSKSLEEPCVVKGNVYKTINSAPYPIDLPAHFKLHMSLRKAARKSLTYLLQGHLVLLLPSASKVR